MQEKMRKLVEESTRKKKEKKKSKLKSKKGSSQVSTVNLTTLPNSSSGSLGKPGAHHSALNKPNSIADSVDDSIASVVTGAEIKGPGGDATHQMPHHATANKGLHNMAAGANASAQAKTPKTKGEMSNKFIMITSSSMSEYVSPNMILILQCFH